MANALMNVVSAVRNPEHWRNLMADLDNQIAGAQARVDANESERGRVALAALGGEAKAQRALDRLNTDRHGLDLELANLTRARVEAEHQLTEAVAREGADALWRERAAQRRDLRERARVAREIEGHLRMLAEDLGRAGMLAERIHSRHRILGGLRILVDPLAPEAVASRLGEFLRGLGVPEGTLGAEASALRNPPGSYAEMETAAQNLYDPDWVDNAAESP
jgi:hypothetical protein